MISLRPIVKRKPTELQNVFAVGHFHLMLLFRESTNGIDLLNHERKTIFDPY